MALTYKIVTRKAKLKGEEKMLSYALATKQNVCALEETIALVEKISAISSGDVKSVLDTLSDVMARQLAAGRIVDLGDLGRFRLSARSKACEKADDFNRTMLQVPRTIYVPGKQIKQAAKRTAYMLYDAQRNNLAKNPSTSDPSTSDPSTGGSSQEGDPTSNPGGGN